MTAPAAPERCRCAVHEAERADRYGMLWAPSTYRGMLSYTCERCHAPRTVTPQEAREGAGLCRECRAAA